MILILCGKSGCGKDTVLQYLVNSGTVKPIVSTTSRPIREGEINGREYNFVTKAQFMDMIGNNELLEYRSYNTTVAGVHDTWYYGSPVVDPAADNYGVVLDIQGAKTYINKYGRENCRVIMLTVPDEIREARAKLRGGFDKNEWDRRMADDAVKFSADQANGVVDAVIQNTGLKEDVYESVIRAMERM